MPRVAKNAGLELFNLRGLRLVLYDNRHTISQCLDGSVVQNNGIPIYVQLREQILALIGRGTLKPGSQLPTMREVAVALKIDLNTVQRAYAELERDGVLAKLRGVGTYCHRDAARAAQEAPCRTLQDAFAARIAALAELGAGHRPWTNSPRRWRNWRTAPDEPVYAPADLFASVMLTLVGMAIGFRAKIKAQDETRAVRSARTHLSKPARLPHSRFATQSNRHIPHIQSQNGGSYESHQCRHLHHLHRWGGIVPPGP